MAAKEHTGPVEKFLFNGAESNILRANCGISLTDYTKIIHGILNMNVHLFSSTPVISITF